MKWQYPTRGVLCYGFVMTPGARPSELKEALRALYQPFRQVMFFSLFTNFLALSATGYMLEVYDRVLNSRSHSTLLMLTVLVLLAYVMMEILEWVRSDMLHRTGLRLDAALNARVFNAVFHVKLAGVPGISPALSDLRTFRDFLSSPTMLSVLDTPIALLILLLIYWISPVLGMFSLAVAIIQIGIAYLTESGTRQPLIDANQGAVQTQQYVDNSLRNAEVIEAMGMQNAFRQQWKQKQRKLIALQALASDRAGLSSALAKFVQITQSSALLGLGVWLTFSGEFLTVGMMFVASILGGRAIAPIVQVILQWKQVVAARDAYARLDDLLTRVPVKAVGMPLPPPKGTLTVEGVVAAAPGTQTPIIRGMNLAIPAGTTVAVIGPSASGKSSLARLMVGVWPASSGKVRLDGADIHAWNKAELGPHIGYLPQDVELFDGSLADNIARFGEVDQAKVEAAATAVGLHELIMALPNGYSAEIGDEGCFLSGGQRQRVALARAIYGNPRFIVLDEPNSSLDEAGDQALVQTLRWLKSQGTTIVIVTNRSNILQTVDRILVVFDGTGKAYGPRDEVLAALQKQAAPELPANPAPQAGTP
jgi:ATP-binding cassette subfamily C exporter for protease/lipase